jgi:glycosyltransferase involved in cell wall biosynthesis
MQRGAHCRSLPASLKTIVPSMGVMRVIELAAFDREQPGSFVPMLAAIMEEVSRRGWRGEVVLPEKARSNQWVIDLETSDTPIRFATLDGRRALSAWLAEIVAEAAGPTLLHTHFTQFDVAAALAGRHSAETSVVWHVHTTLHGGPIPYLRNAAKYAVFGRMVDLMLCPSLAIASELRRRFAPSDRLDVFPSAIDLDRFPLISPERRADARATLGLPPSAVVLLHFGWDWELKGGDLMLEATRALLDARPDRELVVLTRDSAEARRATNQRKLADVVRLEDAVPDVRDLYAAADIVVSSSAREGMPFTIVEALASGTPVVATDIPGHAFVGAEVDACRLAESNGGDIAAAVEETLRREPRQVVSETNAARAWLVSNLSIDMAAKNIADIFARHGTPR